MSPASIVGRLRALYHLAACQSTSRFNSDAAADVWGVGEAQLFQAILTFGDALEMPARVAA